MAPAESLVDDLAGGMGELIPLVGPLLSPVMKRFSTAIRAEHAHNTSIALRAAERAAHMSLEDLALAIEENPPLVPLVTRLLFAAGMTGQEERYG